MNRWMVLLLVVFLAACAPAVDPETAPPLPSSLKGYELYSWEEGGEWRFTLITGTNRLKTAEEIQSGENSQTDDGFVRQTARGVEALKELLAKLPPGESVTWLPGIPGGESGGLALPPEEMISAVEEHAAALGLELVVAR